MPSKRRPGLEYGRGLRSASPEVVEDIFDQVLRRRLHRRDEILQGSRPACRGGVPRKFTGRERSRAALALPHLAHGYAHVHGRGIHILHGIPIGPTLREGLVDGTWRGRALRRLSRPVPCDVSAGRHVRVSYRSESGHHGIRCGRRISEETLYPGDQGCSRRSGITCEVRAGPSRRCGYSSIAEHSPERATRSSTGISSGIWVGIPRGTSTSSPSSKSNTDQTLDKCLYHDLRVYLPALLHLEDRVSMALSIESRVPLLDYRIVEFMATVPPEQKVNGFVPKYLLREAVSALLPQKVCNEETSSDFPCRAGSGSQRK